MNNDTQPQSREEWFNLVKEQAASGLTQTAFCKQRNLVFCRFGYYKKQYTLESDPQTKAFSPVLVNTASDTKCEIKIELPNGFRCHVSSAVTSEKLKQIVTVLLSC